MSSRNTLVTFPPFDRGRALESLVPRPTPSKNSKLPSSADLEFNYQNAPVVFWITHEQGSDVLFDIRPANFPTYASPYVSSEVSSNNFAIPSQKPIFENLYLQLAAILQANESIFILGACISSSGLRLNSSYTMAMWTRDIGDPIDGTTPSRLDDVMQYRINGGTLDMYFYSGVTSGKGGTAITQYVSIGTPALPLYCSLVFHFYGATEPTRS
ncbi:hypothetical protein FIBSPDRAFT_952137 [Athelia psychrophila]|uniref:Uncharacterized protein n=1 Tax=Athelia psychrophila TaxID=1759441 RepID=A0A166LUN1_9AGAM|nr:hypothetical protein FIBSPDRAFT_952137 [Fibularhizoctonia sp. CBS 109695]